MKAFQSKRWGNLTLVRVARVPVMAFDHRGEEYVADTHGPRLMFLECDCGREFTVPVDEFPGRRALRHCPGPDCPYAQPIPPLAKMPPGAPRRDRSSVRSISMPESLGDQVAAYASANNLTFSKACSTLMREGLIKLLTD